MTIELYTAATGNGHRAGIAVAESGLAYTVRHVDLATGEQNADWYRAINPRGQIPTIIDRGGPGGAPITIAQSGAIMLYLAEKTGRHLPTGASRVRVIEQFMHVCSDIAGLNGAITHVDQYVEPRSEAAVQHFQALILRFFADFNRQLADQPYLADDVSIADLALYPHVFRRRAWVEASGLSNLLSWADRLAQRPGVQLGMSLSVQP